MQNSRIPIEVCEVIIDFCLSRVTFPDDILALSILPRQAFKQGTRTLSSCALTCAAWLPRSRANLYRTITFETPRTVELFSRTARNAPSLALLVEELSVSTDIVYIPFAPGSFAHYLRNLRVLYLSIDWRHYPPGYHRLVHQYPLRQLVIHYRGIRQADLRLIWALPHLRSCGLLAHFDYTDPEKPKAAILRSRGIPRVAACKKLVELTLIIYESLHEMDGFLHRGALGNQIEQLELAWRWSSEELSEPHLDFLEDFISDLTELKHLTFKFVFWEMSTTEISKVPARIRAILRRLPFPDKLHMMQVSLQCHDVCDISDGNDLASAFSAGFHGLLEVVPCLSRIELDVEGPEDILKVDWDVLQSTIMRSMPGTGRKLDIRLRRGIPNIM